MNDIQPAPGKQRILIVSGLSGAGKTLALKTLEDMRFEAMDNVPLNMLADVVRSEARQSGEAEAASKAGLAIGIDSRSRAFTADQFLTELGSLNDTAEIDIQLLFLDCDDTVLQRRYQETRRRHPLSGDGSVQQGIDRERTMMMPLQEIADHVMDTSSFTNPEFRQVMAKKFHPASDESLTIAIHSFSYRLGLPQQADLVFDVRFLKNPHYEESLRDGTGQDIAVATFIEADPDLPAFMDHLSNLLFWLLPKYRDEGKSYLDIAIGCTGGQHRSVFVAEAISKLLREKGFAVRAVHRDITT